MMPPGDELVRYGGDVAEAGSAGACVACMVWLGLDPQMAVVGAAALVLAVRTGLTAWTSWRAAHPQPPTKD